MNFTLKAKNLVQLLYDLHVVIYAQRERERVNT